MLLLGLWVIFVPVFGYQLKGIVIGGTSAASSSNYKLWGFIGLGTAATGVIGVEEQSFQQPRFFYLFQNQPNPVISGTYIEYALPKTANVTLTVYDMAGRTIRRLVAGTQKAGVYRIYWNGTDDTGKEVPAGIYFYHMEAGNFKATRKLAIIR